MTKKIKQLTEEEFVQQGYHKYMSEYKGCNYLYQKRIIDDIGVRFFIEIMVYIFPPRENFCGRVGYSSSCAYQNSEPYAIFELSHIDEFTLKEIEEKFILLWETIGKPYYSLFEIEKENS